MISIIIPTYKEAASIRDTILRAGETLGRAGEDYELIVVDDNSGDGTAELAEGLGRDFPVRVLRRPGRQGLATAVVDGWKMARGDLLGVIDADLQHPPEVLLSLAKVLRGTHADLAVATRYVEGGGSRDWRWARRFISWGATHMAATVLPLKLSGISDPMSGMFLVRGSSIAGITLSPLGYKILLEVLAKGRIEKVVEVPYQFEERARGSSKLGPRQYAEYLAHLLRLSWSTGQFTAWTEYSLVGLTGAAIDIGFVNWAAGQHSWRVVFAALVAVQAALLWNFFWNQSLTFRLRLRNCLAKGKNLLRFLRYERVCAPGGLLNICLTSVLAAEGIRLIWAASAGVAADGLLNLLFNVPGIWKIWGSRNPMPAQRNSP